MIMVIYARVSGEYIFIFLSWKKKNKELMQMCICFLEAENSQMNKFSRTYTGPHLLMSTGWAFLNEYASRTKAHLLAENIWKNGLKMQNVRRVLSINKLEEKVLKIPKSLNTQLHKAQTEVLMCTR